MSLYTIELSESEFDQELVQRIQNQAAMNRAIQENLKPLKAEVEGLIEI